MRRKRWLWALLGLPLLLILGLALTVAFLPSIVTGERIRDEAVRALTEKLKVPVEIERVEYGVFSGFVLTGLRIGPPEGFERDFFRAERLAVRYDLELLDQRVIVHEVAVDRSALVLETKNGVRNLDVILKSLAEGSPPAEDKTKEPSAPLSGPLSPLTIVLEDLHLGPLSVELVGEGPNVKLSDALLKLTAKIDPERVSADAELTIRPPATKGANVALQLPAVPPAVPIAAALVVEHTAKLSVAGRASDGLQLEQVALSQQLRLRAEAASYGDAPLPNAVLSFDHDLRVSPADDKAELAKVSLGLDGETILDAKVSVNGLYALVAGQAGEVLAATLAGQIGLAKKAEHEALSLVVERFALPLAQLEAYARPFVPGLSMAGAIDVTGFSVSGAVAPAVAGRPDRIAGVIGFHDMKVSLPSAKLAVGRIDGELQLGRDEAGAYTLAGVLGLAHIAQGENKVPKGSFGLELVTTALAYPPPGETMLLVKLEVEGLNVPGTTVGKAIVSIAATGTELLTPERAPEPIAVTVDVDARPIRLTQPNGKIEIGGVKLALTAAPDQLLAPSRSPIPLSFELRVPTYLDPAGNAATELKLKSKLVLDDPRLPYFDLKGELGLEAAVVSAPGLVLKSLVVKLRPDAKRIGAHAVAAFPGGAPSKLPATLDLGVELDTPELRSGKPEEGEIVTGVHFETQIAANPVAATARIDRLKLALENWLALRLSASARDIYAESPAVEARLDLDKLDLGGALSHLPPAMLGEASDLTGSGKISASVELSGRPPKAFDKLDLGAPPISTKLTLELDDLSAGTRKLGSGVEHLNGKVSASLAPGAVGLDGDLKAGGFEAGQGTDRIRGSEGRFLAKLGLADRLLAAKLDLSTSTLVLGDAKEKLDGVKMAAHLTYPLGGDVELQTLELEVPLAGLFVKVWGRLSRQEYGVFKPDLAASARIDLDALKKAEPALASVPALEKSIRPLLAGSGKVSTRLEMTSKSETRVDVFGEIELERFSWTMPNMELTRATGRIPVEQRLLLPEPFFELARAESVGALGDDLEARLDELQKRMSKLKAMLVTDDILVTAPRTADHDALRPYFDKRGADLKIEKLVYKKQVFSDIHFEGAWRSGIFQIDRFQTGLWEGFFLGDLAVQMSPDLDVRVRARGVATKLNLDIPYAMAKGIEAEKDPSSKKDYEASGTLDLSFALRERALNGRIDVLQLSLPLVERLFGAMDPSGESPAVKALAMSERVGVRPVAAKIWISQNLLNVQFDWQRLWVHVSYESWSPADLFIDTVMIFARPVIGVPLLGGLYVIPTVNNTIRRLALAPFIEPVLEGMRLDATVAAAQPWLVAAGEEDVGTKVARP